MRALLVLALLAGAAQADLYVWKDEKGVEHYSSTPPNAAKTKKKAEIFKTATGATGQANPGYAVPTAAPAPLAAKGAHTVALYTTSWCPHCREARDYLRAHGIAFQDFDIESDAQANARYRNYGGHGIPLAVIDGSAVTGFSAAAYDQRLKP